MDFLSVFSALSKETRIMIGHQYKDFFRACTFKAFNCINET